MTANPHGPLKVGDLVQVAIVGAHVRNTGFGGLTLRLAGGTLVALGIDEPGVTIALVSQTSGSSAASTNGSSPDPDGASRSASSTARAADLPSPVSGGPGGYLTEQWMPTGHHYGPGDLLPGVDPALAGRPAVA